MPDMKYIILYYLTILLPTGLASCRLVPSGGLVGGRWGRGRRVVIIIIVLWWWRRLILLQHTVPDGLEIIQCAATWFPRDVISGYGTKVFQDPLLAVCQSPVLARTGLLWVGQTRVRGTVCPESTYFINTHFPTYICNAKEHRQLLRIHFYNHYIFHVAFFSLTFLVLF